MCAFWPVPEVDSALIHLRVRSERLLSEDQERRFLKFVHNLFIHPRKQLKNVLAGLWGLEVEKVKDYFVWLGLPETVRSQELTIEEWKILFEKPL
jgi:16S rRNA (adenine1518-N6/adenine1519-N6)-dimethyltransferase